MTVDGLPPGPRLPDIIQSATWTRQPVDVHGPLCGPIRWHLYAAAAGPRPWMMISHPDAVKEVTQWTTRAPARRGRQSHPITGGPIRCRYLTAQLHPDVPQRSPEHAANLPDVGTIALLDQNAFKIPDLGARLDTGRVRHK